MEDRKYGFSNEANSIMIGKFWNKQYLLLILAVMLPLFLFGYASEVKATVMVGDIANYGKTNINYFMNHNYIERDKPYLYEYSVKALERVRQRLVKEGKLKDNWVVIEIPSTVFELESKTSRIELKPKCQVSYGETNQEPAELEKCYSIYFVGESNYKNFLTLILALQQLNKEGQPINIQNLNDYAQSTNLQADNYLGGVYYTRPVWAPSSKFVAFGVWKDGQVYYEVYDLEQNTYLKTDPLGQMFATESIWSSDSQYLIFASLSEIKIFEIKTASTKSLNIGKLSEAKNLETLLSFDTLENKLVYAFDKNLLAGYDIYEYDFKTGQSRLRVKDVSYISWPKLTENSFKWVTSPDGRWEAKVEDLVGGSSRDIKKLSTLSESVGNNKVEILPPERSSLYDDSKRIVLIIGGISLLAAGFISGVLYMRHMRKKHLNNPAQKDSTITQ